LHLDLLLFNLLHLDLLNHLDLLHLDLLNHLDLLHLDLYDLKQSWLHFLQTQIIKRRKKKDLDLTQSWLHCVHWVVSTVYLHPVCVFVCVRMSVFERERERERERVNHERVCVCVCVCVCIGVSVLGDILMPFAGLSVCFSLARKLKSASARALSLCATGRTPSFSLSLARSLARSLPLSLSL
jgi:hypothetical protein